MVEKKICIYINQRKGVETQKDYETISTNWRN